MIQKYCAALGESGCYFLSILHLAEKITGSTIDPVRAYEECVKLGHMDKDCFVTAPGRILGKYVGGMYEVVKSDASYAPRSDEFEILRFERPAPGKTWAHFVVGNGFGRVEWDSEGESQTVAHGRLVSKRIFRKVA